MDVTQDSTGHVSLSDKGWAARKLSGKMGTVVRKQCVYRSHFVQPSKLLPSTYEMVAMLLSDFEESFSSNIVWC